MKQALTRSRYERIHEPQLLSLMVSVGLHGMAIMVIMVGTWFWGGAPFLKPAPSYTVALVDVPLSLKNSIVAVKPSLQVKPPSSKVSGPKPAQPNPKPVKAKPVKPKPVKSKPVKSKPVKPKPAQAKLPPSKPEDHVAVASQKANPAIQAPPRALAESLDPTSAEAASTLAKLRQRLAKEEADRQQAETVAQQAAAQRLADLRQQVSQEDEVGRAAMQAVGLQQVRLAAYQERLRVEIVDAWVLPLPPEQSRELRATAFFRVLRDGRVEALSLVQASGNTLFDASLMRAIKRASPLPHLPPDYPADALEVEMRFQARES